MKHHRECKAFLNNCMPYVKFAFHKTAYCFLKKQVRKKIHILSLEVESFKCIKMYSKNFSLKSTQNLKIFSEDIFIKGLENIFFFYFEFHFSLLKIWRRDYFENFHYKKGTGLKIFRIL